uniref:extracellular solute-binding protein n=1 Tax=Acetatifactor sp. TaxID=1872090 RepID=UPI004057A737
MKDKPDEKAFASASFNDYLYGVPFNPNTWVMYYNREIFTEEDVKSIEAMVNKDTGLQYNFSCAISSNWYIEAFYYAKGCTLFGEDGMQEGQCSWNNN